MLTLPKNTAVAVLASAGINGSQTTIPLASGQGAGLPDPATRGDWWGVVFNYTDYKVAWRDPTREYVLVKAISGDTITNCERGKQGTGATAHNTVGKTYYIMNVFTEYDAVEIPFIVEAVMTGAGLNEVTINIPFVTASTKYEVGWGLNPDPNAANPYSQPIGSLYIVEKGVGFVKIRADMDQGGIDRRISIHVQRVAS